MIKKTFASLLLIVLTFVFIGCKGQINNYEIEDVPNDGNVFYEIFVGGFYDSNNDGIGDLNGVKEKIPYLEELGISGIWLMPIMPSFTYHKYDVRDYKKIDSSYGTLDDFDALIERAEEANIDIIIDLVLNHSALDNPWFYQAVADYESNNTAPNSKKDYYNFSPTPKDGYVRYKDGIYYEARFWSGMPDLNLDNENLREEIVDIAKFWLNRGVKGFRLDAVKYFYTGEENKNIEFLSWFNDEVKKIRTDAYIVGEAWENSGNAILPYYNSQIDSLFSFQFADKLGILNINVLAQNGQTFASEVVKYNNKVKEINPSALISSFLTNHDIDRSAEYLTNESRQKLSASAYILMPGTPYMYYGEEIGMVGSGKDENKRLPMIWKESDNTGQTKPPVGYDFDMSKQVTKGAYDLLEEGYSLLNHYKKVISLNNKYTKYLNGNLEVLDLGNKGLCAIKYSDGNDSIVIIHNFSSSEKKLTLEGYDILDQIETSQIKAIKNNNEYTISAYSSLILG